MSQWDLGNKLVYFKICDQARKFSMGSSVVCKVAYGGTSTGNNLRELQRGCNILVATPGRLLDFVSRGNVVFSNIQFYVLYEADRMLDMGFGPDINKCMTHRTMQTKENLNTLMFSATFPEDVRINARQYLRQDKIFLSVGIVVYVRLFIRLKRKIRREDFWSCWMTWRGTHLRGCWSSSTRRSRLTFWWVLSL